MRLDILMEKLREFERRGYGNVKVKVNGIIEIVEIELERYLSYIILNVDYNYNHEYEDGDWEELS